MEEYNVYKCMSEDEILSKKYTGRSRCNFSNGDIFEGYWIDGKISKGKMIFKTGDVYEGFFDQNGQMSGNGIYIWVNGDKYDGNWVTSKRSGDGRMNWNDGTIYRGYWKDDVPCGIGTYIDKNGKIIKRDDWGISDEDLPAFVSEKVKEGVENPPVVIAVH